MRRFMKKSVLKNYLITYVGLAVAVCAALGVGMMLLSAQSLNRQERAALEERLASAGEDLCYQLDRMREMGLRVCTANFYQPVFLQKGSYNEMQMLENFALLSGGSVLADAYYLFYEDTGAVYTASTKMTLPIFLRQYAPGMDEAEFLMVLRGENGFVEWQGPEGPLLFRKEKITFNRYSRSTSAWLIFRMDRAALSQRYESLFRLKGAVTLEVDGAVLLGEGGETPVIVHRQVHEGETVQFSVRDGVGRSASSAMRPMLNILMGMTLLFTLASAYLAWNHYKPIRALADRVGGDDGQTGNEIQAIAAAVDGVIRQSSASLALLTANLESISRLREALKQQILLLALSGEYDASLSQRMADAGLNFTGNLLCVAHIAPCEGVETEELRRRISALSDSETRLYLAWLGGGRGWALLISAQDESGLMAAFDTVSEELGERYPDLRIHQGKICDQVQKLAYSLAVAESAQERDSDARAEEEQAFDAMEEMKKCMSEGSEALALACLDTLLSGLDREYPSLMFRRYRVVEIAYQILTFGRGLGCPLKSDEIKDSLNYQDTETVRETLADVVRKICASVPRAAASISPSARIVMEHIGQHATDYDICLDSVAAACDISTKQVSRVVRSVVGMSFKEYVSHLRMRRAMELLRAGASSTETAPQVGYSDISHFTKVFRAHTGCTPGQFRDQALSLAGKEPPEDAPGR